MAKHKSVTAKQVGEYLYLQTLKQMAKRKKVKQHTNKMLVT